MDQSYFLELATYNKWANHKLYDVVQTLSEEALKQDRKMFFTSILGTLNHILVGDLAWFSRLEGSPRTDLTLDKILYDDMADLWSARQKMDDKIIAFITQLKAERLKEDLQYRTIAGEEIITPVPMVLGHVFNHQTHHRGQVHGVLSAMNVSSPSLDIIYFMRE